MTLFPLLLISMCQDDMIAERKPRKKARVDKNRPQRYWPEIPGNRYAKREARPFWPDFGK